MKPYRTEYFSMIEQFVDGYQEKNHVSPTILEMESALGIPKTTVARYLKYMDEHGMLDVAGRRRIVTRKAKMTREGTVSMPVLGAVSCGIPKFAEENIEEYVSVPVSWFGHGEYYALRADGDSMKGAGIDHGDLVIVSRQNHAEPGQIIVALVGSEEATLKRYRPDLENNAVELVPENDEYEVRRVNLSETSFGIQGVAVKVVKDLR